MGNVPVVHEVGTSFASLGDAITGNPEKLVKDGIITLKKVLWDRMWLLL